MQTEHNRKRISETENTPIEIRNQKRRYRDKQKQNRTTKSYGTMSNILPYVLGISLEKEKERDQRNIWGEKLRFFQNLTNNNKPQI